MIRLIGYFFGLGTILFLGAAFALSVYLDEVTRDLPDYEVLASYSPPVMTRVHASNGSLIAEYAHERRLFLPIQAIPDRVKAAFLSAEDKNFYQHAGVDFQGVFRAIATNIQNVSSGKRPVGASTITQQVAKNFLLTGVQTYDRKIKEAILAFRIEQAYSKDKILELYLNEIFFGLNSYGLASAALTYFDKPVTELTIAEAAYLAALPKGPANYHPIRKHDQAIERRNWVVDRMVENGYVTNEDGEKAKASELGFVARKANNYLFASDYFASEVRRQLAEKYGDEALSEGGLSVRTSLDPALQLVARKVLQDGLIAYDETRGFHGLIAQIETGSDWGVPLSKIQPLRDVPEWKLAVVLATDEDGVDIGLRPDIDGSGKIVEARATGRIEAKSMKWAYRSAAADRKSAKNPTGVLNTGDVVYVQPIDETPGTFRLRQPPKVQGGFVAMDPPYWPRAGNGWWLLLWPVRIQPRHAGNAPARFILQAVRLCRRTRQWLYAGVGGARWADRDRVRWRCLAAAELWWWCCWSLDASPRH